MRLGVERGWSRRGDERRAERERSHDLSLRWNADEGHIARTTPRCDVAIDVVLQSEDYEANASYARATSRPDIGGAHQHVGVAPVEPHLRRRTDRKRATGSPG